MESKEFVLNFALLTGQVKEVNGRLYLYETYEGEEGEVFIQIENLEKNEIFKEKKQRYLISGILSSQLIYRKIYNFYETKLFVASVRESVDQYNAEIISDFIFRNKLNALLDKYSLREKPPPNNIVINPFEIIPLQEPCKQINRVTVAGKVCTGLITENRDYGEFIIKVKNFKGFSEKDRDYFTVMVPQKIYRSVIEFIQPGIMLEIEGKIYSKKNIQKKYSGQIYRDFRKRIQEFVEQPRTDKKVELMFPESALKLITESKIECHHVDILSRGKEMLQKPVKIYSGKK
ncbi:MAG: hypothetical protein PHV06_02520 [bacterium]|nr:hypothetical protein [bacterium]